MKSIVLTNSDRVVLVDDEFYLFLSRFTWSLVSNRYAQANIAGNYILMHQLILNSQNETDHIDNNTCNNLLINLRPATRSENSANRKKFSGVYSSQYKGVSYNKRDNNYRATIKKDGVKYELGSHKSEKRAAREYDKKAIELFGSFASLNFPPQLDNIKEIA